MKNEDPKTIQKTEEIKPTFNIETLISQAVSSNASVESLERLLAMRKELKAEWAKEEYDRAMAAFQAQCPIINKTKSVSTNTGKVAYKYAPIESIVSQVKDLLEEHGFSYKSEMEIIENGTTKIKVTIRVTHKSGHFEDTPFIAPLGTKTQIMSDTQVFAAAQTFAKRYAFCNAFGILTSDDDIDARPTKETKELEKSYIEKIDNAKSLEELVKVGKEIGGKIKSEFREALRIEYTRRKNELGVK